MKQLLKFLLVLVLFGGCEGGEPTVFNTGPGYFPLKTGYYQVYSVTEKRYSGYADPAWMAYELKTEVVDSFPSEETYVYIISRSRRSSETEPWEALDTWSARKNSREVIVSEGNTAFLKFVFPVREGTLWNGNSYNTLAADEYRCKNIATTLQVGGMTFDNTLTVEQEQNDDLIVFHDLRREVYAMNIGLVYREIIQLNYCTDDHCLGQQKIVSGIEMKQEMKEYGTY